MKQVEYWERATVNCDGHVKSHKIVILPVVTY